MVRIFSRFLWLCHIRHVEFCLFVCFDGTEGVAFEFDEANGIIAEPEAEFIPAHDPGGIFPTIDFDAALINRARRLHGVPASDSALLLEVRCAPGGTCNEFVWVLVIGVGEIEGVCIMDGVGEIVLAGDIILVGDIECVGEIEGIVDMDCAGGIEGNRYTNMTG